MSRVTGSSDLYSFCDGGGGKCPYSWSLVGCCRQDLFNTALNISSYTYNIYICFEWESNAINETDIIIYYNELSPLIRNIPEHNILIIGGDMNG